MRLLPPKELNTKLNEQKRSEIDAGVFLAKKVDALREQVSVAQSEHDIAIANINKEFDTFTVELCAKKRIIENEVFGLEERRQELLKPLDEAWQGFHIENDELLLKQQELQEQKYKASQRELEIDKRNEQSNKLYIESMQEKKESESFLQHAKDIFKTRQTEGKDFLIRTKNWEYKKSAEEGEIEKKNKEIDRKNKLIEETLTRIQEKERLLDLRLLKNARNR